MAEKRKAEEELSPDAERLNKKRHGNGEESINGLAEISGSAEDGHEAHDQAADENHNREDATEQAEDKDAADAVLERLNIVDQMISNLEQVEAALAADPSNEELSALRDDLVQTIISLQGNAGVKVGEGEEAEEGEGGGDVDWETRYQGHVKWFNAIKGYGFILPEGADAEGDGIFVHRSQLRCSGFKSLAAGTPVSYTLSQDDSGRVVANNVAGPDGKDLLNGFMCHVETRRGRRDYNEDRYIKHQDMGALGSFFGVLDGHGGSGCVEYTVQHLGRIVQRCLKQCAAATKGTGPHADKEIKKAITEAFVETDNAFFAHAKQTGDEALTARSGSTAITAVAHGTGPGDLTLYVANLGDSRAVMCRGGVVMPMSFDHKPNRTDERARIEKAGGYVAQVNGVWRVTKEAQSSAEEKARVWLAVSRAFGDGGLKQPGLVSATPEIRQFRITDRDLFMVFACDGIWDVLSDQEVVDLTIPHMGDPKAAANAIVDTAYDKGSQDNLTALVVMFGWQMWRAKDVLSNPVEEPTPPVSLPDDGDIFG